MDVIRFLVGLHPRRWRERHGDEFAALLEETRLSSRVVMDVVLHAGRLHVRAHRRLRRFCAVLVMSVCVEVISLRAGLTANVLWAPTNLLRALALIATAGPWIVLAGDALFHRYQGRRQLGPQSEER